LNQSTTALSTFLNVPFFSLLQFWLTVPSSIALITFSLFFKIVETVLFGIVFPFIIWFYGSAIVIIRGWGCGFGDSEDIVTWSDNRPSFTVLGFMAVVAYCRGI
jgi:hypothetical protein